jgi:hypothetical protein
VVGCVCFHPWPWLIAADTRERGMASTANECTCAADCCQCIAFGCCRVCRKLPCVPDDCGCCDCAADNFCRILKNCPCCLLIIPLLFGGTDDDRLRREKEARKKSVQKVQRRRRKEQLSHEEFQRKMDEQRKDLEDRYLRRGKYAQNGKGKSDDDDCAIVDFEEELDQSIHEAEDMFDRSIAEAKASGLDSIVPVKHSPGKTQKRLKIDTTELPETNMRLAMSMSNRNLARIQHEFISNSKAKQAMEENIKLQQKERSKARKERRLQKMGKTVGQAKLAIDEMSDLASAKVVQATTEFHEDVDRYNLEKDLIKNKEKERTRKRKEARKQKRDRLVTIKSENAKNVDDGSGDALATPGSPKSEEETVFI